ncbi:MAG: FMN-binding protein, partial [Scardovia wiggsiae]
MKKKIGKSVSLAALGILASGVLLAGCGQTRAVPADDSYAGGSEESSAPSSGSPSSQASKPSADPGKGSPRTLGPDTGIYADGTFTSVATYGPVSEDSIDVAVTVANQQVSEVKVTPHPAT